MSRGRVLLVDDDDGARESLAAVLEYSGYKVEAVCNGAEALAALRIDPAPCVIVLDLTMPVLDGWRVVENMSRTEELASLPVVITSAVADDAPVGVAHVLSKPVNLRRLLNIVGDLCKSNDGGDATS